MKPTPWTLDGFDFFDENTTNYIYLNSRINNYLEVGPHEKKFFLVGGKGLGKTLLLRYKSYLYHTKLGGSYKFNTSQSQLTDNLDINYDTFSREELFQFQRFEIWDKIWSLALWILAFRTYELDIPLELERIIDGAEQITPIFSALLSHRNKIHQYTEFRTKLLNRQKEIQSGIALFIDDVDQSFEKVLRDDHYIRFLEENEQINPAAKIWVNAQNALVAAIYSIYRQNSHIKIFANIRREPWESFEGALKANYLNHATILNYEKGEISEILKKNILRVKPNNLAKQDGKNLIERFFGFETIPHPFAKDEYGNSRKEPIFDFIYRHTCGRPREIVQMGRELQHKVATNLYKENPVEEKIREIRSIVNAQSFELFHRYRSEIIPGFDEMELKNFISKIKNNVILRKELEALPKPTINLYFSLGLLGYTINGAGDRPLQQKFLPPATYNYRKIIEIPEADFYLIHTIMDGQLIDKLTFKNAYDKVNIIGNGYPFFPINRNSKSRFYENNPLDYYPIAVSGNRWETGNLAYNHKYGLKLYYELFFSDQERRSSLEEEMELAQKILILVARICYCARLTKELNNKYAEVTEKFKKDLTSFNIYHPYSSNLSELDNASMEAFHNRLFGRLLFLGCFLFNDLTIHSIHQLLLKVEINFRAGKNVVGDSAYRYIQKCFFIKDLKNIGQDKRHLGQMRKIKQAIFNSLSVREKKFLVEFSNTAIEEARNGMWIQSKEDREWLKNEILVKVWQPSIDK